LFARQKRDHRTDAFDLIFCEYNERKRFHMD
jgi:hypothetical protein